MRQAPFLVVVLLLMTLPWPASSAMPGVARWAAPQNMRGMAQFVRARRASNRHHRARHAPGRAGEAPDLDRARSDKAGKTPEQRSSAAHQSPPAEPKVPSERRASKEKLAPPRPLSKQSPAPSVAPSAPIKGPEVGNPAPVEEPPLQPPTWSDAEVIGGLRRCISELASTGALVQA